MRLPSRAQWAIWDVRRAVGLTAFSEVRRELRARGVALGESRALDVFGGTGRAQTVEYGDRVAALEIWEINPALEPELQARFTKARIKITDAFMEVMSSPDTFDLIVVDNPNSTFGAHDERCEHFDLFPDIFRLARTNAVFILNVFPLVDQDAPKYWPGVFNDAQLERRRVFYRTKTPESVPFRSMLETYERLAQSYGFHIAWYFWKRAGLKHLLVFRVGAGSSEAHTPGSASGNA